MAQDYKITCDNTSAANISDLTDPSINPDAMATTTARQGGFTLNNRVNFTNVALGDSKLFTLVGATAATAGRLLRVLEVPERTMVSAVNLFAVYGETVPGSYLVGSSGGVHTNHLGSAAIGVGIEQRSKPVDDASYSALSHLDMQLTAQNSMGAGAPFGEIGVAVAGAAVTGGCAFDASQVLAVTSSMANPELARIVTQTAGVGSAIYYGTPSYFPFGGYIYLGCTDVATSSSITADNTTKADGTYLKLTGTWHFNADCTYIPV
jgi:hypothetical protein